MANFYDVLIDSPTAETQFKNLCEKFEKANIASKEIIQTCLKHVSELKKLLNEEYKK